MYNHMGPAVPRTGYGRWKHPDKHDEQSLGDGSVIGVGELASMKHCDYVTFGKEDDQIERPASTANLAL